ncbi:MAG: carbohydrate binding family 9 domain-containing protein [Ignavibacteriales bacterium]|nr:MAG: carbohydrate binding family 9 domain-containing protein [Ignavibacteriales bacterium]
MKKVLLFTLALSYILAAAPNEDKVLRLKKTTNPIIVDGNVDAAWAMADSVEKFFQLQPYFKAQPTRRTVAKVLTTNESIYCIMICYDERDNIQNNTGLLDDFAGDIVSFMIDTFNDKKTAYKFAVNASGVRADSRMLDDARNRDYSWDGIWFADSKVYDWGFVVEMEIPYKSIQYQENLEYWGLDFDRWIPANSEDLYWCEYEQNEGQRISKFGKLVFEEFTPSVKGLNLEFYPVALSKAVYLNDGKYDIDGDAGLDVLYNPSSSLKFLLTANPDFAQIEADPYDFNISRYESFFDERRPFFTEGNEVFTASGRQRNTGFYRPLELFYSRRIGKLLPDGSEVPLLVGTKAFGRINDWEYGGFFALTGEQDYKDDDQNLTEPQAWFGSGRIKKQILDNSSVGILFVGKQTKDNTYGVVDIDGAFRTSEWQLSYQVARSIKNSDGDFAASAGLTSFSQTWLNLGRIRYIGDKFDINQVGYVPWIGTTQVTVLSGPIWRYDEGYISQILLYGGFSLYHEKVDAYMDRDAAFGYNMQFRDNWGFELNLSLGRSKDSDKEFTSYEASLSSWYNISPKWSGNLYGGYTRTYNFDRDYLAYYSWLGAYISWQAFSVFNVGTSYNMYTEFDPDGKIEDIAFNARPYFSLTPINDLNIRVYVDNVFIRSTDRMERIIAGFLFSYNFLPKSWIYFAINEAHDRSDEYDTANNLLPGRMHLSSRAAVLKIKYLYYF